MLGIMSIDGFTQIIWKSMDSFKLHVMKTVKKKCKYGEFGENYDDICSWIPLSLNITIVRNIFWRSCSLQKNHNEFRQTKNNESVTNTNSFFTEYFRQCSPSRAQFCSQKIPHTSSPFTPLFEQTHRMVHMFRRWCLPLVA